MFNKVVIENVLGINNEIEIDFMATPKKKERRETVIDIEPNVSVNKVVGIIGSNASGKSSIVDSLIELRGFLAQNKILEIARKRNDEKLIKYISNNMLPERNLENLDKDSKIILEMYIPYGEMPGYYTYSLIYNEKILREKLLYRKKYKSKKILEVEDFITDNQRSDIGYKCFYKDSILKDYEATSKQLVDKFNETLKYYNTFYNYYMDSSINEIGFKDVLQTNVDKVLDFIKKNEELILNLLKIVDPQIINICYDIDETGNEVVKFITRKNIKLNMWDLSTGTIRIIQLMIRIVKAINNNGIMLCDEIETALHKELVQLIIGMYLKSNNCSQLLFTTHIPEILDQSGLRNDQKYYLSKIDDKVIIRKISTINSRSDYSISKNYYSDDRYMPQPTKEQIKDFCENAINKINKNN